MFYTNNRRYAYPSRTILEDVLSRYSNQYAGSTTGLTGCRELLREQLGDKSSLYTLEQILAGYSDYNAMRSRPNDDTDIDGYASDRSEYYTRLEEIDARFVHKYALEVIIGFKKNNNGRQRIDYASKTAGYFMDEESGSLLSGADIAEVDERYTPAQMEEAKAQLPYLLKVLQLGSQAYHSHLLSFIIAREQIRERDLPLLPKNFVGFGVYKLNHDGSIGRKYEISDNTNTYDEKQGYGFRATIAWVCGKRKDTYYDAYERLLHVLEILEINITNENPLDYGKDVVEEAVCTYLATNEEFIADYGMADKNLVGLLKKDSMFNVVKKLSDERPEFEHKGYRMLAQLIDDVMYTHYRIMKEAPRDCPGVIWEFFNRYTVIFDRPPITKWSVRKAIIVRENGTPILVRLEQFVREWAGEEKWAVLTIKGDLVVAEDITRDFTIRFVRMTEVIEAMRSGKKIEKGGVRFASVQGG